MAADLCTFTYGIADDDLEDTESDNDSSDTTTHAVLNQPQYVKGTCVQSINDSLIISAETFPSPDMNVGDFKRESFLKKEECKEENCNGQVQNSSSSSGSHLYSLRIPISSNYNLNTSSKVLKSKIVNCFSTIKIVENQEISYDCVDAHIIKKPSQEEAKHVVKQNPHYGNQNISPVKLETSHVFKCNDVAVKTDLVNETCSKNKDRAVSKKHEDTRERKRGCKVISPYDTNVSDHSLSHWPNPKVDLDETSIFIDARLCVNKRKSASNSYKKPHLLSEKAKPINFESLKRNFHHKDPRIRASKQYVSGESKEDKNNNTVESVLGTSSRSKSKELSNNRSSTKKNEQTQPLFKQDDLGKLHVNLFKKKNRADSKNADLFSKPVHCSKDVSDSSSNTNKCEQTQLLVKDQLKSDVDILKKKKSEELVGKKYPKNIPAAKVSKTKDEIKKCVQLSSKLIDQHIKLASTKSSKQSINNQIETKKKLKANHSADQQLVATKNNLGTSKNVKISNILQKKEKIPKIKAESTDGQNSVTAQAVSHPDHCTKINKKNSIPSSMNLSLTGLKSCNSTSSKQCHRKHTTVSSKDKATKNECQTPSVSIITAGKFSPIVTTCFKETVVPTKLCSLCFLYQLFTFGKDIKKLKKAECSVCPVKRMYKCPRCSLVCPNLLMLYAHSLNNAAQLPVTKQVSCCFYCNKQFLLHSDYYVHVTLSKCSKFCVHCEQTFKSSLQKKSHKCLNNHVYQCSVCKMDCASQEDVELHMSSHEIANRDYSCRKCGASFYTGQSLFKHMDFHIKMEENSTTESSIYVCYKCKSSFKSLEEINQHWNVLCPGMKQKVCYNCTKQFDTVLELELHMKERDFGRGCRKGGIICFRCRASFVNREDFKHHLMFRAQNNTCLPVRENFQSMIHHLITNNKSTLAIKDKTDETRLGVPQSEREKHSTDSNSTPSSNLKLENKQDRIDVTSKIILKSDNIDKCACLPGVNIMIDNVANSEKQTGGDSNLVSKNVEDKCKGPKSENVASNHIVSKNIEDKCIGSNSENVASNHIVSKKVEDKCLGPNPENVASSHIVSKTLDNKCVGLNPEKTLSGNAITSSPPLKKSNSKSVDPASASIATVKRLADDECVDLVSQKSTSNGLSPPLKKKPNKKSVESPNPARPGVVPLKIMADKKCSDLEKLAVTSSSPSQKIKVNMSGNPQRSSTALPVKRMTDYTSRCVEKCASFGSQPIKRKADWKCVDVEKKKLKPNCVESGYKQTDSVIFEDLELAEMVDPWVKRDIFKARRNQTNNGRSNNFTERDHSKYETRTSKFHDSATLQWKNNVCLKCRLNFDTYLQLDMHLVNEHGYFKKYFCKTDSCDISFSLERSLDLHHLSLHANNQESGGYEELYGDVDYDLTEQCSKCLSGPVCICSPFRSSNRQFVDEEEVTERDDYWSPERVEFNISERDDYLNPHTELNEITEGDNYWNHESVELNDERYQNPTQHFVEEEEISERDDYWSPERLEFNDISERGDYLNPHTELNEITESDDYWNHERVELNDERYQIPMQHFVRKQVEVFTCLSAIRISPFLPYQTISNNFVLNQNKNPFLSNNKNSNVCMLPQSIHQPVRLSRSLCSLNTSSFNTGLLPTLNERNLFP
ncbi:uncharacterized protein LOC131945907 [Physella acuta]|uniref:uncharacterized protein LOC131945907 n=1 Tax=Physella acuta TaxID=109671 RepID=UPI0027DD0EE7|nr:uncharacterized protein LOC131945907 [Physella acuta]XP_059162523.1 uncharacterized protein LOC131945907 [Physella acuta]XP_059162524.1 uncharacterized protein LOC131945907 [Physella acuta]